MFTIEKNIPLKQRASWARYPFREMEVGDSFIVPADILAHVRNAAAAFGKSNSRKYRVLKTEAGHRCWRVN